MAYRRWLSTLAFEHPAQQIAFQDYVDAVMDAERWLIRMTCTALPITLAGRFSPLGPRGMGTKIRGRY
jgi:hypothetical protein